MTITDDGFAWVIDRLSGTVVNDLSNVYYDAGEFVNAMETTGDWSASADATALAVESGLFIEGAGMMKLGKSGTTTAQIDITDSTATSIDATDLYLEFDLYIADKTTLDKLRTASFALMVRYGNDASNYNQYEWDASELNVGWNFIKRYVGTTDGTAGTPAPATFDYILIRIFTNNTSDTFTSGKIMLDNIRWTEYSLSDISTVPDQIASVAISTEEFSDNLYEGEAVLSKATGNDEMIVGLGLLANTTVFNYATIVPLNKTSLFQVTGRVLVRVV